MIAIRGSCFMCTLPANTQRLTTSGHASPLDGRLEVARFIGEKRLDRGCHCQDEPAQFGRLAIERTPNAGDGQLLTVHADLNMLEVRIQLEDLGAADVIRSRLPFR